MKTYFFVAKIRIQTALAYRFNVFSTILIQCLIMYAMSCFWIAAYSGKEMVSGVSRRVLEMLPFMNIYQLPLGIYVGQYTMHEIMLRTMLQLFWCVILWLLFDVLQKKASAVVLIQGG